MSRNVVASTLPASNVATPIHLSGPLRPTRRTMQPNQLCLLANVLASDVLYTISVFHRHFPGQCILRSLLSIACFTVQTATNQHHCLIEAGFSHCLASEGRDASIDETCWVLFKSGIGIADAQARKESSLPKKNGTNDCRNDASPHCHSEHKDVDRGRE